MHQRNVATAGSRMSSERAYGFNSDVPSGIVCRRVFVYLLQMKRVFILIHFRESFKSKKYKESMLI